MSVFGKGSDVMEVCCEHKGPMAHETPQNSVFRAKDEEKTNGNVGKVEEKAAVLFNDQKA